MANPTVPVATIAGLLCITERRVQQLAKEGVIPKDERGQYSLVASVQGYIRYLQDDARAGKSNDEMYLHKTRSANAKATIAEMKARQMAGALIPASDIGRAWAEMVGHMRAKLLALPNKLAPQLVGVSTLNEIQTALKKQICEALQELSETRISIEAPADGASQLTEAGL